jgi:hypothetical protein
MRLLDFKLDINDELEKKVSEMPQFVIKHFIHSFRKLQMGIGSYFNYLFMVNNINFSQILVRYLL